MVGYVRLVWKLLGKVGECVNAPPNTTQVTLKAEVKTTLPAHLVVQVIVEQLNAPNLSPYHTPQKNTDSDRH